MRDTGTGKLVTRQTSRTVRPRNLKKFEETCLGMTYELKPALLSSPFVFTHPNTAPWWPQLSPIHCPPPSLPLGQGAEHWRYAGVSARFLKALLLCVAIQNSVERRAYVPWFAAEALFLQGCLSGRQSLFSETAFLEAVISAYPTSTWCHVLAMNAQFILWTGRACLFSASTRGLHDVLHPFLPNPYLIQALLACLLPPPRL